MTEQKVVRTWSSCTGGTYGTSELSELLSQGYKVIMCNEIKNLNGTAFLEYIVETEKVEENDKRKEENKWIPCDVAVDFGYLYDWYIASVDNGEPVWTEAHLRELCGDFILIPKSLLQKGEQYV